MSKQIVIIPLLAIALCATMVIRSQPAWSVWRATDNQHALSVCDVAVFDERYEGRTVAVNAFGGPDVSSYYLRDDKCSDRMIMVEFPLGSGDSGVARLVDIWRPREAGEPESPALGKRVYCTCVGKIHYVSTPKIWVPVMSLERVDRVWTEKP